MKHINANTRISQLIKAHPGALEAIISINSKFEKLRNPLLRKVFAGRTSIAMASKIAGCNVNDFFLKLKPLGFIIDDSVLPAEEERKEIPPFMSSLSKEEIIELDVREMLASGNDPLNVILDKIKSVKPGEALKVINTFEPVPLIQMLEKKGFELYPDIIDRNLVETYFYRRADVQTSELTTKESTANEWDEMMHHFNDKMVQVDVRDLPMPQPMLTILARLEQLPPDHALFVNHKRTPLFLLPELAERNFDYRIKEISDGNVWMLIFPD